MTIAYPVRASAHFVRDTYGTTAAGAIEASAADRIAAALNYCADLTDDELTNDDGRIVLDDRDALLAALKALQANPNDPRAHRTALNAIANL